MLELVRKPPLIDIESKAPFEENGRFALRPISDRAIVKLQLGKKNPASRRQVERALGVTLPENPQQPASGEPTVFWAAPGEWLIVDAGRKPAELAALVAPTLAGQTHAITDLSDSLAVLQLSGVASAALLAEACAVDFHPSVFVPGQYALTRFGPLAIVIHRDGETAGFRLYVDRSLARFLWNWLLDAQHRGHS